MKEKTKFISDIDYNKSSKPCSPCAAEVKKIDKRINKRKLSEIKSKEVPHILKVFNFWFSQIVSMFRLPLFMGTNTFHVYKADYKLWELTLGTFLHF